MAKEMGHSRLYCVDYWTEYNPFFPDDFDRSLTDYFKFAQTHNQEHLLPMIANTEEFWQDETGRNWIDFDPYESLVDMHKRINAPEYLRFRTPRCELGCPLLVCSEPENLLQSHSHHRNAL